MLVAILGDFHGDYLWVRSAMRTAKRHNAALLCAVGDTALEWPGLKKERLADRINELADDMNLPLLAIRGNHDNVDVLFPLVPLPGETFCRLRPNIWYLPDGAVTTFEHDGEFITVGGLGGATSIDRDWRMREEANGKEVCPRTIYWPEERPPAEAAEKLIRSGQQVDLLLTHEAPRQIHDAGVLELGRIVPLPDDILADQAEDIQLVTAVRAATSPRLHAHGHFHQRVTVETPEGSIIGLGMEGDREGAMVLWDSVTGEVTDLVVKG